MMGYLQFMQRTQELLDEEKKHPERLMYLSFAGEEGWRGAVIIKARGMGHAVLECHLRGINPHGQVMGIDIPEEEAARVAEADTNRLLSLEDCQRIWPG